MTMNRKLSEAQRTMAIDWKLHTPSGCVWTNVLPAPALIDHKVPMNSRGQWTMLVYVCLALTTSASFSIMVQRRKVIDPIRLIQFFGPSTTRGIRLKIDELSSWLMNFWGRSEDLKIPSHSACTIMNQNLIFFWTKLVDLSYEEFAFINSTLHYWDLARRLHCTIKDQPRGRCPMSFIWRVRIFTHVRAEGRTGKRCACIVGQLAIFTEHLFSSLLDLGIRRNFHLEEKIGLGWTTQIFFSYSLLRKFLCLYWIFF